MYLRKVGSLLSGLNCATTTSNYSTKVNVNKLITNYLGVSEACYEKDLKSKTNLENLEYDTVKDLLQTCNRLGFNKKEFIQYPHILRKTPNNVEIFHSFLKEVGFKEVTLSHMERFNTLMHERIVTLKTLNYIPKHLNISETLISILHPKPIEFNPGEFNDQDILINVHTSILKQYLMWRLKANEDEIKRLFVKFPSIKYRSLQHICENIALALKVGYTTERILKYGYILMGNPDYPRTMLEMMPNFGGGNVKSAMHEFPKLMTMPPRNFKKIYQLLKDAQINDSALHNYMNIFSLSPNTVRLRLKELSKVPEMNVFRSNPHVLQIIVHHNRARSRLTFLQQLQLRCTTLQILGKEDNYFLENLREGKDINKKGEVLNFLRHMLNYDVNVIEQKIKQHPYYLQVSLVEMEKTINYLQKMYSKKSIVDVLPIVLYSRTKIMAALETINDVEDLKAQRLTEVTKLHLVLYFIEKEHHFTGNGIW